MENNLNPIFNEIINNAFLTPKSIRSQLILIINDMQNNIITTDEAVIKLVNVLNLKVLDYQFEIDFDGNLKALLQNKNNNISIVAAVNGWGEAVNVNNCKISKRQHYDTIK